MDSKTVKENIRKIREGLHLTQQDMADKMNISRTSFRQMEAGKTKLISSNLEQFALICGVSLEECLLGYKPLSEEELVVREQNPDYEYLKARFSELESRLAALQEELEIKNESIKTLSDINTRLVNQLDNLLKSGR